MRQAIENPTFMTADEIEKTFVGKWVYIVNAEFTRFMDFVGGIPVVYADDVFEGQKDGFYEQFRIPKYAPRYDTDYSFSAPPLLNMNYGKPAEDAI
ncbi:MAG: hypothetical protein FWD90_06245 [Defluviitaleaceae bacterium]|nr:hypothetical protein [Defluviitaleaceae bacterium]